LEEKKEGEFDKEKYMEREKMINVRERVEKESVETVVIKH
jgi:hypothetical protein